MGLLAEVIKWPFVVRRVAEECVRENYPHLDKSSVRELVLYLRKRYTSSGRLDEDVERLFERHQK